MTLGELELIRIKTLKKINKSKKSISISTIFFMITNFIILVPYFVMNYFNEGTILGGGISIICIMSFVLYWSVIYEIEKENIFWIVEFVICFLAMAISANVPIIGLFYLIYLYVKFYKKNNKQELKESEKDYSIEFRQIFKEQYLMPYIEKFGYKYQMYSMIDMAHITNSRLFSRFFKHGGNDKIQGTFEGIKFEFSDIFLQDDETENYSNLPLYSIGIKNAKGILFYADFNKKIKSSTFILQNVKPQNMQNLKTITMDDSEFNDKFKVYSSDAQNAMYILSPALMRRILHFERRVKFPINISFVGTKIYIFIQTNKDNFEPDINKSVFKYDPAKEIKEELSHMLSIVRILKLNRKIWSVEK